MDPDRDDLVTCGGLRLRDLVLVVWELEVLAAGVDVEPVAQVLHGHRGALDVPPREPRPPGGIPFHEPMLAGALPQREVGVVLLVGIDFELLTVPGPERGERVARQLPVVGERLDVEVHSLADLVGVLLARAGAEAAAQAA